MRRIVSVVLFCIAAGLVWHLLFSESGDPGQPSRSPTETGATDAPGPGVAPDRAPEPTPPPGVAPGVDRPGWVRLRVVERGTKKPVVKAGVQARPVGDEGQKHFQTGTDGAAWIGPVRTGALSFRIDHGHYIWVEVSRYVAPSVAGGDHPEILVELTPGLAIAGRLVTTAGEPSYGQLRLRALEPSADPSHNANMSTWARDGNFRFPALPAGRYEISLWRTIERGQWDRSRIAGWVVAAGQEDLVLNHGPVPEPEPIEAAPAGHFGMLLVRCLGPDGTPLKSARVDVVATTHRFPTPGGGHIVRRGNAAYPFRVDGGTMKCRITEAGRTAWVLVSRAVAKDGTPLGAKIHGPISLERGEISITVTEERTIRGRVLTESGEPVPNVALYLRTAHPGFMGGATRPQVARSTAPRGEFRFGQLGGGGYRVYAEAPAGFLESGYFHLVAGAQDAEIVLRRAIEVDIRVLDAEGEPVGGAEVWAFRSDYDHPFEPTAVTDWNGRARLSNLDPDRTYEFAVFGRRSGRSLVPHVVKNWRPLDTTVYLAESAVIRGNVVDAAGEPVDEALVVYEDDLGQRRRVGCTPHGGFEIPVPAGATRVLRAVPWSGDPERDGGPEVIASAGPEQVILRLERGVDLEVRMTNWPAGSTGYARIDWSDGAHDDGILWYPHTGVFLFRGLPKGKIGRLSIAGVEGGLALTKKGIRSEAGSIEVELEPGLRLTGTTTLPPGVVPYSVVAVRGLMHAAGELSTEGRFRFEGLCEGTWKVVATAVDAKGTWEGSADLPAGGTGRITLERTTD